MVATLVDPSTRSPLRATVEIDVLGALVVRCCEQPVAIRRGHPRVLLSSLVLYRGRAIAAEVLADQLWGEHQPAHPLNALQTQIAYTRRMLGGTGAAPILTLPNGYALSTERLVVDADRFEELLADGRVAASKGTGHDLEAALARYDELLMLWRGTPYAELVGRDVAEAERVRLEELRLSAEEERCDVLLRLGRAAEAAADAAALALEQPLRERRSELLVLALYRDGRQAEALREYQRTRRTLADELGIEPGPRLQTLERQVLEHDRSLDWIPPTSARTLAAPAPSPSRRAAPRSTLGQERDDALIGREREIEAVRRLLDVRRLVTLTGPGGAGKTRLAMAVAGTLDRPVRAIDLAAANARGDVLGTIGAAIGARHAPGADPLEAIVTALGGDANVLLLDTCERVAADVAWFVEHLLGGTDDISVLATSRRPLELADELAWPVPPLAVPVESDDPLSAPAVELFVRRALEVAPDFEVDDADVVALLCRTLDGLPLAIELAAAQMDVLSPAAVLAQIAESRTLPARRGGPERHRTLAATTDWSVGLLDDDERDLLHRLAVFPATFDLDAAVAVDAGGERRVDRFIGLVRSSLVTPVSGGRFRLFDTVRAHVRSIDDDHRRRQDALRRHAEHFAVVTERADIAVRGPTQTDWLARLRAEAPNLDAALAWCFGPTGDPDLGARIAGNAAWAWTVEGRLSESLPLLERASAVATDPAVRAKALLGVGLLAAPLGEHALARRACSASIEIATAIGDEAAVAAAELTLGVSQWAAGDIEAAAETHDRAIARHDTVNELWGATICRVLRARTARDRGDLDLADALLDVAVDDAKQTGDHHVIGLAFEQYTRSALARGDVARAALAVEASLRHNEELGHPEGIVAALGLASAVRRAAGEEAAARELQVRALAISTQIGHIGAMCASCESLAELDAARGEHRTAAATLLVVDRARSRRGLARSTADAARVDTIRTRLQRTLGAEWDAVVAASTLTSLPEQAARLLAT